MVMSLPQPSESFVWTQEPWGAALRCVPLRGIAPHLFTSCAVSVSRAPDDPALAAVAASLCMTPAQVRQVHQVHGTRVVVAGRDLDPVAEADVLLSEDPDSAVAVRVADCAPILLAQRQGQCVAAVHAGWRGTAAGAVGAAVRALGDAFGARPVDLLAAIGPTIGACCYEVGSETREAFAAAQHPEASLGRWFRPGRADRWQLDVPRANRDQLEAAGVPAASIFDSGLCTACHAGAFYSYRREGGAAGRLLGIIAPGRRAPSRRS